MDNSSTKQAYFLFKFKSTSAKLTTAITAGLLILAQPIPGIGQPAAFSQTGQPTNEITSETEIPYILRPLPEAKGFAFTGPGTTGGDGGPEITVTNAEELLYFATSNDPYIINVVDTIDIVRGIGTYEESHGEYHLGSNTTLRGVGPNAMIRYGGFRISGVENVIIQNLTFDGTYNGYEQRLEGIHCTDLQPGEHRYKNGPCLQPGDKAPTDNAIEITEGSENIWITQITIKRYSDEAMSVKREASNVTLSWNRYDDLVSGKNGMMVLIGHSDSHEADRGRLRVTLHNNYFASSDRQPRLRFGKFHIFNNYYHNVSGYGIASTQESQTLAEGNYFENVNRPWRLDFGDPSRRGFLVERDNIYDNTDWFHQPEGELGVHVFDPVDYYEYDMEDAADIPDIVLAGVGAGNWHFEEGRGPVPSAIHALAPADGATGLPLENTMIWSSARFGQEYQVRINEGYIDFSDENYRVYDHTTSDTSTAITGVLEGGRTYFWQVRAMNDDGPAAWSKVRHFSTKQVTSTELLTDLPDELRLHGNYPNPFNPTTRISFDVPDAGQISLNVYNVLGQQVASLVDNNLDAGTHTVTFDGSSLTSGMYIYRLQSGSEVLTRTMMLVK